MKRRSFGVVALIALVTACSGTPEEPAEPAGGATGDPGGGAAGDSGGGAAGDSGGGATGGSGGGGTVLIATVGTEDDPEAFVIALTTEDGEPVTSLPAGDYTIQVSDPATIHNFHLTGESVDESTSVPDTEETTWEVTLEPGEYTYTCDPHPSMTGTFTVT